MNFYAEVFGLEPKGGPSDDGVPEPLQFDLGPGIRLMLIPTGGFGWVLEGRAVANPDVSECVMSLQLESKEEVDRLVDRVPAAGGEVDAAPAQQDWGYAALVSGPDGHAWQFVAEPVTG
ncbi:MAG TPA: VOC family protein [Candidatus Agrococcus pullicola]|uniref:VOC family protein n=1 Tax=Candidatus Agrococcus pullicola TaxID=2838429 RepID=A0A9D1YV16_9MICO|nr:VOC family protein [Candidatus Agrococcus pullicola]